eukprot:10310626-Lingulodinium_polyedra.AAC.1
MFNAELHVLLRQRPTLELAYHVLGRCAASGLGKRGCSGANREHAGGRLPRLCRSGSSPPLGL